MRRPCSQCLKRRAQFILRRAMAQGPVETHRIEMRAKCASACVERQQQRRWQQSPSGRRSLLRSLCRRSFSQPIATFGSQVAILGNETEEQDDDHREDDKRNGPR